MSGPGGFNFARSQMPSWDQAGIDAAMADVPSSGKAFGRLEDDNLDDMFSIDPM